MTKANGAGVAPAASVPQPSRSPDDDSRDGCLSTAIGSSEIDPLPHALECSSARRAA